MKKRKLWEILVPVSATNGKKHSKEFHQIWDEKVREISGGLTILNSAKGHWINGGELIVERMIPVRLIATKGEFRKIIDMTLEYYEQETIMGFKLSDEILMISKSKK